MTKRQAREWVHTQLILDELDCEQLVQVFTVLAERKPDAIDRHRGLFRYCFDIALAASPAAPPDVPALSGSRRPYQGRGPATA